MPLRRWRRRRRDRPCSDLSSANSSMSASATGSTAPGSSISSPEPAHPGPGDPPGTRRRRPRRRRGLGRCPLAPAPVPSCSCRPAWSPPPSPSPSPAPSSPSGSDAPPGCDLRPSKAGAAPASIRGSGPADGRGDAVAAPSRPSSPASRPPAAATAVGGRHDRRARDDPPRRRGRGRVPVPGRAALQRRGALVPELPADPTAARGSRRRAGTAWPLTPVSGSVGPKVTSQGPKLDDEPLLANRDDVREDVLERVAGAIMGSV